MEMSSGHAPHAVPYQPSPAAAETPTSSVQSHRRRQSDVFVRSVGSANLAVELATIRSLLPQHPFVTVHAEYPGCDDRLNLLLPPGVREENLSPAERYALAKIDVDTLPLFQLGITICSSGGRLPVLPGPRGPGKTVWQIGFQDVSLRAFTAALFASRVVAPESVGRVRWVAFGGLYHFGLLLKILTGGKPLPGTHQEFSAMLAAFLGRRTVFDARYVASKLPMGLNLGGDLSATAALLDAPEGRDLLWQWQQAGEKSLAAWQVFMRTMGLFFAWHGVGMHTSRIHGLH